MRISWTVVVTTLLAPAIAAGEVRSLMEPGTAAFGEIVAGPTTDDGLQLARQVLPPSERPPGTALALAQSRTIYLNKNGVTLQPSDFNDARTNRSSIAAQLTSLAAWNVTPATWSATVTCMRELFADYDINIVEQDPGAVPHIEAVFGGSPANLNLPSNVAGISPFTTNCGIIENSIVFTFTAVLPQNPRLICEIMAQEVAHSFGLDHELLPADPMTYLPYDGERSFQNQTATCGETTERPCGINGSVCRNGQNSVALLTERLGPRGGDTVPPTGSITSPSANATVPPGFSVYANASDDKTVASAKLLVDGVVIDMVSSSGPYTFTTPGTLAEGPHRLKIEISDGANIMQTQEINVTVQQGAPPVPPPGQLDDAPVEITGGCSTGRDGGVGVLALGLLALARRRRR